MAKTKQLRYVNKLVSLMMIFTALSLTALGQDDDVEFSGRVVDGANKKVGKVDFIQTSNEVKMMFGYYLKVWLDGGRLRVIRTDSGTRSTTIICSFREYTVNAARPNDDTQWEETGSGTATLKMTPSGEVRRIDLTMTLTEKVIGDNSTPVNEPAQKFTIMID
ncbi:MAG: hypothetical protein AB7Q37_08640 [Pyrinomonadaceae bacterium]